MATIYLYGEIGWDVSDRSFAEELGQVPEGERVTVAVNSPGGDVFQAQAMGALAKARGGVDFRIDGIAASAASYMVLNGETVTISSGGMMMIHKPLCLVYGNSLELQELITILDKIEDSVLVPAYARKTGIDAAAIKEMLAEETWLDSDQSVEMGFVDGLSDTPAILDRLPAKFASIYNRIPEALRPEGVAPVSAGLPMASSRAQAFRASVVPPVKPKAQEDTTEDVGDTKGTLFDVGEVREKLREQYAGKKAAASVVEPGYSVARARLRLLEVA